MNFSVGLWDALFGEKCIIEVRGDDGHIKQVAVTKRWLEKMEREGQVQKRDGEFVEAHVFDVSAGWQPQQQWWKIGEDIEKETVVKWQDPQTNAVYAIDFFKDGKPVRSMMSRQAFEIVRINFEYAQQGIHLSPEEFKAVARERGLDL